VLRSTTVPADVDRSRGLGALQVAALKKLRELEEANAGRLTAGGYDDAGARVTAVEWRQTLDLDSAPFWNLKQRLIARGAVVEEGVYVRSVHA
jgi:hypothetical protein